MEQVRKDFEMFAKQEGYDISRHERAGFYLLKSTHKLWKMWQAAHELYTS